MVPPKKHTIKSFKDYKDPVRVHKMLIDERMEKIRNQSEFANLEEELHRLKGELDDQKRKKECLKIILTLNISLNIYGDFITIDD